MSSKDTNISDQSDAKKDLALDWFEEFDGIDAAAVLPPSQTETDFDLAALLAELDEIEVKGADASDTPPTATDDIEEQFDEMLANLASAQEDHGLDVAADTTDQAVRLEEEEEEEDSGDVEQEEDDGSKVDDALGWLNSMDETVDGSIDRTEVRRLRAEGQAFVEQFRSSETGSDIFVAKKTAETLLESIDAQISWLASQQVGVLAKNFEDKLDEFRRLAQINFHDPETEHLETAARAIEEFRAGEDYGKVGPMKKSLAMLFDRMNYAVSAIQTEKQALVISDDRLSTYSGPLDAEQAKDLLKTIKPGSLTHEGPGPMGMADPKFSATDYPQLEIEESDGKFSIKLVSLPTSSASHVCTVMPIGTFSLGEIQMVAEGKTYVESETGSTQFTYKIDGASPSWERKILKRGVSAETHREVTLRELEHLVDFDYAFEIGPVALAKAMAAVAGAKHDSKEAALDALITELQKTGNEALIPADPREPSAWSDRMSSVMMQLTGFSKDRDTRGTHSPAGNTANVTGTDVIIEPVFKSESLKTEEIISLSRITPVYTGVLPEPEPEPQQEPLQREIRPQRDVLPEFKKGQDVRAYDWIGAVKPCLSIGGQPFAKANIDRGTKMKIESEKDDYGFVWFSADIADLEVTDTSDESVSGKIYFEEHVENAE